MSNNNMFCDLQTGICGEAGEETTQFINLNPPEPKVRLYYVTDPICSHCWALEPVLRRFEEQYGHYVKLHTVMGGLLESWNGFADAKNGINGPADVAGHWKEVGLHSRMPIDGSLWHDNPIQSSYPPSRVYKIIQAKDAKLAKTFLRRAREAVFAFNRNIGDERVLIEIVSRMGLDGEAIVREAGTSAGQQLLEEDFSLARSLGVRGFPTIIMVNEDNKGVKIVGARPLENYVEGLRQVLAEEALEPKPLPGLAKLLQKEGLLFAKELEAMYDIQPNEVKTFVQENLSPDEYAMNEILDETYIQK
ncbi:DsbA family oxidoreductase [Paenibacillus contaminans]|uniref:DsbA family protein n=1 Tax=Paenibacillus contaminans TaxID=450362 RepID=A0A329LWQ9_9BACL|nr:DsbA family protein [Paenibacillus contaminans]RAV10923.1 DsbA family protein [Paenibacillus contaminans]